MSDTTTDPTAMLAALQAQLAALQRPSAAPASPWAAPPPPTPASAAVIGVSVPIRVQTPAGKVICYLALPAEAAASPAALMAAIEALVAAGVPVDAWQPKDSGGGGSWGSGNRGGGWSGGNSGGGWRR